ncbi:hypothetical protein EUTSA_v10019337mg [Eutrema salsugineum]|uniref:Prolamin-like domain-containing protein n=1 Tax=Eutrema salsugineum TaxID=72664 RepID=V4MBM3_EUTSA|nr:hypothetical protein EUTSA_v10019337mg [Eutrema salsugineum]
MARLSITMVFFLVLVVTSAYVLSFAVEETEPKKLWDQCVVKISPKCALDIIGQVFGNGAVSNPCFQELVKEGKECHDTLIKYIADRPTLKPNIYRKEMNCGLNVFLSQKTFKTA